MDSTVRDIPVREIRLRASELLRETYPDGLPAAEIDVEYIIQAVLGLDLVSIPGLRRSHDVFGAIGYRHGEGHWIAIDEGTWDRKPPLAKFTLAEEVGHYVLHVRDRPPPTQERSGLQVYKGLHCWVGERNAKRFAAELIMPMATLVRHAEVVYASLAREPRFRAVIKQAMVIKLAKLYGVSRVAMENRFNEHGGLLDQRIEQALADGLDYLP